MIATIEQPAVRPVKMTASDVIAKLRVHYPKEKGFVFLEQVANTTGYASRYADAIVMNVWHSRFEVIGIEVKVSRSDWLSELKKPSKADKIFQYCHSWYIATPAGIIRDGELPPAEQIGTFNDSFRKGFSEADAHIAIQLRSLPSKTEAQICPECLGAGWVRGGKTDAPEQFQCQGCLGTGVVPSKPESKQP